MTGVRPAVTGLFTSVHFRMTVSNAKYDTEFADSKTAILRENQTQYSTLRRRASSAKHPTRYGKFAFAAMNEAYGVDQSPARPCW